MKKGDKRLAEIYNFIQTFIDDNGFAPSVREIAEKFSIKSTSTVHYYLDKLKRSGSISQDKNKKRAVTVNKTRSKSQFVPLLGKVSAGSGILAVENVEGEYPIPKELFADEDLYLLRVDGQSMINVGINDGDLVIVHSQNSADIGEIVVALWQDTATVKRLVSTSPDLVLHPENDSMTDIVIPYDNNPAIIGKVVGCIKRF
ncbi:MAG: transcriptional repressor LexA [Firmicutes bacterium]|nr:transcriptional repressor LexA [Bacillota bacterium]